MKQRLKSEDTQNLIIEKAFDLFYKNGYNNTSIPEIMAQAKLTKGAFYHHFNGKKEIGKEVIIRIVKKRIHDKMILPLIEAPDTNVIQTLKDVFTERIINFTKEEKEMGCPANNLINEVGYSEEIFRIIFREMINLWREAIINLLEKGKQNGEINNNTNSSAIAVHLITSFEGVRGIRKIYDNDTILVEYLSGLSTFIDQLK